ncbi:Ehd1 [Symbiodinium necroappetens]|uniref:Ehd1 protein n=1 Tax=Symbiodinium necroappetens TaxID=1628268 RepID=A0A812WK05_9DINO|nr:Ehd1 [Symbiodinium necroappetens]
MSSPGADEIGATSISRRVWNMGALGVLRKLWQIYAETVLPLEQKSFYEHFCAPPISLEEFEARPQVLLLGQYSTGKTSMVKWLTESESNYFDVRPQPSTDKFMAVVHGDEEGIIHGNAAACLPQLPYQGLSKFGTDFLGSFQALVLPSEILRDITFIDTPGVLSGSKQRIGRDYDFAKISAWMADRADLVLLTFDAHKLDISDEFQQVMEVLRPHAGKVRCVLNKADQIDASNLVRVYGALLWNVGKVFQTPEVARVFVSSFWNEPYRFQDHVTLFEEDKAAVVKELQSLPHTALLRKINNLTARVRRVRTHVIVVGYLRSRTLLSGWSDECIPQARDGERERESSHFGSRRECPSLEPGGEREGGEAPNPADPLRERVPLLRGGAIVLTGKNAPTTCLPRRGPPGGHSREQSRRGSAALLLHFVAGGIRGYLKGRHRT